MRTLKSGFVKLFADAAGRQAVEALITDLLGINNSPAAMYNVRNIGGTSKRDDDAHLVGFQILEIDSSEDNQTPSPEKESSDEDFNLPSNVSEESTRCMHTFRNREQISTPWPIVTGNYPAIVSEHTFVPDGTCKLIAGNVLLIESVKYGFGNISEENKRQLFYECCTDLTKQKEVAGMIVNAQQAMLFHFLRDDTLSTIATRVNIYDFTDPENNNLERLSKDILKLITQVEKQFEQQHNKP